MLETLRERVTELEQLQQRADRLRTKRGTTTIAKQFYLRVYELAGEDPPVDPDSFEHSIEMDVLVFAGVLQLAVDRSAAQMLGLDESIES